MMKKNRETKHRTLNSEVNEDIYDIYQKLNIETPEKRNDFKLNCKVNKIVNYSIGYSSTTDGLKNA